MYTMIRKYAAVSLALLAVAVAPSSITAQPVERGAVFVAIPDDFPDVDARFVLIREPGRDVVILHPEETTAEALYVGLRMLHKFEDRPRPPGEGQMIPVSGFALERELPERERLRLERMIERVRDRPVATMGRLGTGRWMPVQAG